MVKAENQYKVLDHISKAQSFIFSMENYETSTLDANDEIKADLPFSVCAFEGQENPFVITNPMDSDKMWIDCIVAEELTPEKTIYHCIISSDRGTSYQCAHNDDTADGKLLWQVLNSIVKKLLVKLSQGQHGHTSPRTVFKWKDQGEKKQIRINKIIHVRGRSEAKESEGTRNVIWSHAFWVMGHWREVKGIGKNRDGVYGVSGKTWVLSYVKNEVAGDAIHKIRYVKNDEIISIPRDR